MQYFITTQFTLKMVSVSFQMVFCWWSLVENGLNDETNES
jgi:hypothetical protein